MRYTNEVEITIEKNTESGVIEEQFSEQEWFNQSAIWIQENTPESNMQFQELLQSIPVLASLKNSESNGFTLLMYAADAGNEDAAKCIIDVTSNINEVDDSYQQTALYRAVLKNHPNIVELLIQKGADVNLEDENGQTALWLACLKGPLETVQTITAVDGVFLDIKNDLGWAPLHLAVITNQMPIVKHLVDMGVNINEPGRNLKTALHIALLNRYFQIAEFLITCGADLNVQDENDQTPLCLVTVTPHLELAKRMIELGANPYIAVKNEDTVFDIAAANKNIDLLKIYFNNENTANLLQAILNNDKDKIEKLLLANQYREEDLRALFIFLINSYQFELASLLLEHQQKLQSQDKIIRSPEKDFNADQENGVTRSELRSDIIELYREELHSHQFFFEGTAHHDKAKALIDAFAKIKELLCDLPTCIELLKRLDDGLGEQLPQLSKIKPEQSIIIKGLPWPAITTENHQSLDKKRLLRSLLRSYLQNHGIETQKELYNFAGFVSSETANALIRQGALFKEQFLMGNALVHGLYTHYIQWYIIARAIDEGRVKFKGGLRLKDVLVASVDVKTAGNTPAWTFVLDALSLSDYAAKCDKTRIHAASHWVWMSRYPTRYSFSYVNDLTSFLYTCPDDALPHLRGYLLDSLISSIEKTMKMLGEKASDIKPSHSNNIIAAQVLSSWHFDRLKIFSRPDVEDYYDKHAKTGGKLNPETGIVTKTVDCSFFHPRKQQKNDASSSAASTSSAGCSMGLNSIHD